ncbi:hypothetical protein [Streptomyces sp. NPDC001948]
MDTEHEWPDALCLSRIHSVSPPEDTLAEFYTATIATIDARAAQPAFFLARQLAELSLKALLGPTQKWAGHDLGKLLKQLVERGHELFDAKHERRLIVKFIRNLHEIDPKGDEGRYPTTTDGRPSLAVVCCADPVSLRANVDQLFAYTYSRLAGIPQSV